MKDSMSVGDRAVRWAALALVASAGLAACSDDESAVLGPNPEDVEFAAVLGVDLNQMTRLPSGVYIQDVVVGMGDTAMAGDSISVHYEGFLANGDKFDSSLDRQQPFDFVLGTGFVIPGWDEGILGMKVGGDRQLVIPPELAYGEAGRGSIPPNATIIFEIELIGVTDSQ